jgi:ATP-binding cassette subfamily B protein
VVLFGQGEKTCDDLGQANSALRDAAWDEKIEYSKVAQVMSFLHMATTSAVVAVCIVDFSAGRISVGTIVLLFFMGNRILADVNMFVEQVAIIGQQKEEVLRLCRLFLERTDVPLVEQPLSVDPLRGALTFEKVGFAYPNRRDNEVLREIDMVVAPGETLAIVGLSGSGKSTLVRLLMRFFDVDSGRILVDGKDLRQIDLDQYYSQVGVVSQTVELFDDTIAANIAFGKPGATQDEVKQAAKMACIHEFIISQPDGYDTVIGERGIELSGGQQQRLAIARAIIRDPRILILDEATSHQDMETEGDIKKEIELVRQDRTLIVIAHRLSTIQKADHIVCLEDGRIVEEGDHKRLIQQNGLYSRLQSMRDAGHLSD